jgi:hypothetical protein
MKMKITQYGYRSDPYMDSETAQGRGAYHKLEGGVSCALTESAKQALGAVRESWVRISFPAGGSEVRRVDDRAPEGDKRCDLYNPAGFETALGDFADVDLTGAPNAR